MVADPPAEDARTRGPLLCVDDDPVARRLYTGILGRAGYAHSCASDAADALVQLRADPGRFRLVLTDHDMPGMDGLGLVRAMRQLGVTAPVLVVSAGIRAEDSAAYRKLGVQAIILKPIAIPVLLNAIARGLR